MKLGDIVQWQSQSQGYQAVKEGEIVAVVSPGLRPDPGAFPTLYGGAGPGSGRDHESYIVKAHRIDKHARNKSNAIYWPRVSALRLSGAVTIA